MFMCDVCVWWGGSSLGEHEWQQAVAVIFSQKGMAKKKERKGQGARS